jgi:hypothetical protein
MLAPGGGRHRPLGPRVQGGAPGGTRPPCQVRDRRARLGVGAQRVHRLPFLRHHLYAVEALGAAFWSNLGPAMVAIS